MEDSKSVLTDPSALSTQALLREIENLRALMETRMDGKDSVLAEQFKRVDQQFELVERQRVEQKKDTKDAVDAALTAQKEAVREQTIASERAIAKSEQQTDRQLVQLGTTFDAEVKSLRRELSDAKEANRKLELRVSANEQQKVGRGETVSTAQAFLGIVIALVVIGGFIAALVK